MCIQQPLFIVGRHRIAKKGKLHNTRNNERDVKSPETRDHAGSGSGHRPVKQFLLKFFKKYFKPPKYQYCTRDHGPDI